MNFAISYRNAVMLIDASAESREELRILIATLEDMKYRLWDETAPDVRPVLPVPRDSLISAEEIHSWDEMNVPSETSPPPPEF